MTPPSREISCPVVQLAAEPIAPAGDPVAALPRPPRSPGVLIRAAALLATVGLMLSGAAAPAQAAGTDVMRPEINTPAMQLKIQQEVLAEVNLMRSKPRTCGAGSAATTFPAADPVRLDSALTSASFTHARNMATLNFFSHTGQDGKGMTQRVADAGYDGWQRLSENIAAGYASAQSVVKGWMESDGHCRNLMNADVADMGIGVYYDAGAKYRAYWTQNFGSRPAADPPAAAPQPAAFTPRTPKLTGTARVGVPLTASPGDWGQGVTLKLQWYRDGKKIGGATASRYVPTAKDRGKRITVTVTGSKSGFATTSKTSARTGKVGYGTLTAATPQITGTAKLGKKLKVTPGQWKPSGVKLKYQWLANGKKIKKATKSTLKLSKALKGRRITVKVTGSKSGYKTVSRTSARTAKIRA